jgi:signal transduction histidine kinase
VVPPHPDASEEALLGLNRLATVARLLSGAAHEVNNALQVISGTVEVLELRSDLPPPVVDSLARLRSQSGRAGAALAQVLAFTKAPRGTMTPVSLRELASESLALRDFAIRRARLSARLEAADRYAPLVTGNRGDLQQVVLNLLVNAEQALAGMQGTIVLRLEASGGDVVLTVGDTGPGLKLPSTEEAFDAFVTTRDPFESAGLGLWASRQIAIAHGGSLTIEPQASGVALALRLPALVKAPPGQSLRR